MEIRDEELNGVPWCGWEETTGGACAGTRARAGRQEGRCVHAMKVSLSINKYNT